MNWTERCQAVVDEFAKSGVELTLNDAAGLLKVAGVPELMNEVLRQQQAMTKAHGLIVGAGVALEAVEQ